MTQKEQILQKILDATIYHGKEGTSGYTISYVLAEAIYQALYGHDCIKNQCEGPTMNCKDCGEPLTRCNCGPPTSRNTTYTVELKRRDKCSLCQSSKQDYDQLKSAIKEIKTHCKESVVDPHSTNGRYNLANEVLDILSKYESLLEEE